MPLCFQCSQMLLWVETLGNTTVYTFVDSVFQCYDQTFLLLQKSQTGSHDFAGIVIPTLCDRGLNEILEISSEGYRCRFHNSPLFRKITNIW